MGDKGAVMTYILPKLQEGTAGVWKGLLNWTASSTSISYVSSTV